MLIYCNERMEFPSPYYDVRTGFSYGAPAWILPNVPWYPIVHPSMMDMKYPTSISAQSDESTRSSISPDNQYVDSYKRSNQDKTYKDDEENMYTGKRIKQIFYECHWKDCTCVFTSLDSLSNHVSTNHAVTKGGLFYCCWEGCSRSDKGFNARYKMLVHVRTHTNEKPHKCNQCNKSFSRTENLKIHSRSHSGEKPYVCPIEGCNKAYSNTSDRFKHTKTHSVDKPYFCKIPGCLKRYTDPSSLRKHVKTFKHVKMNTANNSHLTNNVDDNNSIYQCDSDFDGSHRNILDIGTPIEKYDRMELNDEINSEKSVSPALSDRSVLLSEKNDSEAYYGKRKDLYYANPLPDSAHSGLVLKTDCINSDNLEYFESEEPLNLARYTNGDNRLLHHESTCRSSEYIVQNVPSDIPLDLRINK